MIASSDDIVSLEGNATFPPNAAWTYPEPKEAASSITGRVAVWKGVKVG